MVKTINIAIIDYKMSNMFSIKNALDRLGFNAQVTSDKRKIISSDGAILPGVGSFPEAMKHLHDLDLIHVINSFISTGKPFMGICLGLQLLFPKSEEFGDYEGLGIIEGKVESFSKFDNMGKVPHVGWNKIVKKSQYSLKKSGPLNKIESGEYFYFVHSYFVSPNIKSDIYTISEHSGIQFCSSILRDNVFACQFHPEKSSEKGLIILKNFFTNQKGSII